MKLPIFRLEDDMTLNFACRSGDYFVWLQWCDFLAPTLRTVDLWEMRAGDTALLTNRLEDVPDWLDLLPSELTGRYLSQALDRLQRSVVPGEPVELPNLWRLRAGDLLLWMGDSRGLYDDTGGVLMLIECHASALLLGTAAQIDDLGDLLVFAAPTLLESRPERQQQIRQASAAANRRKPLNVWTELWMLG